jgi:hypothetical protein
MKKDLRTEIRVSAEDLALLKKAAKKLQAETGRKSLTSRVIINSVKEYAEAEPEVFFCNRVALRQVDTNIEAGRVMLQAILDQCLAIGVTVNLDEIQLWYGTGRQFMVSNKEAIKEMIINRLFEKQKHLWGLQFSRENILVPDLTDLIEAAGKLIHIPEINFREVGILWDCYSVTVGQISVIPEQIEIVKSQFRAIASTPAERAKLNKVKTLCRALDAFIGSVSPEKLNIPGVCYYDSESNRFEVSETFVKYGLIPNFKF